MNGSYRRQETLMPSIRGRFPQLKSIHSTTREKEDDLILFLEMRKREMENNDLLLVQNSNDLNETLVSQPGNSPLYSIPVARKTASEEFLNSDGEKNDYDWLLTPPGTPLYPSMDLESRKMYMDESNAPKAQPTVLRSRLANSQTDTANRSSSLPRQPSQSSVLTTSVRRPSSSGGPTSRPVTPGGGQSSRPSTPPSRPSLASSSKPSRSSTPTSRATLTSSKPKPSSTRPTSSGPSTRPTGPSRSATPSRSSTITRPSAPSSGPSRSSTPTRPAARSATPTRSTAPSIARSSTPTSRQIGPTSRPTGPTLRPTSRSSTPTRRPSTPSNVANLTSSLNKSSSSISSKTTPPCGSSPTVRSRPWNPSEMPGFSLDAPPNLRTTLPDRPLSATRGRPTAFSARSSSIEPVSNSRIRRQSCSPSRGRASNSSGVHSSGSSVPAVSRGQSKVNDEVSPVVIGTKMVERVINMRKLAPPRQDDKNSTSLSGKSVSSHDGSGFGRTLSKKSLDMAIRHMDIKRSIPGNLRPLMTKIPASSMYSVRSGPTGSKTASVSDSPLATSSNASSEHSVNNHVALIDGHGTSELEDDIAYENR